ncbi:hypothetical protein NHX12_006368 [Muraenolepis orangiensis]|uniref:Uncharacterized protein n=1 Tax=Muraenolepis orangiensis TaxID=630683 RepID=A0A9Q0DT75_9TELE|nr:hypothetical protein NHX12_006368 [Muraenolepis orangiensis]
MQCSAPCSGVRHAVQCTMQCSAPCSAVRHAVQCTMQCSAPCSGVHHAVQCAMQWSAPCSAVRHAVECAMQGSAPCSGVRHAVECAMECAIQCSAPCSEVHHTVQCTMQCRQVNHNACDGTGEPCVKTQRSGCWLHRLTPPPAGQQPVVLMARLDAARRGPTECLALALYHWHANGRTASLWGDGGTSQPTHCVGCVGSKH